MPCSVRQAAPLEKTKQNYCPLATHKDQTVFRWPLAKTKLLSIGHSQRQNYFPLATRKDKTIVRWALHCDTPGQRLSVQSTPWAGESEEWLAAYGAVATVKLVSFDYGDAPALTDSRAMIDPDQLLIEQYDGPHACHGSPPHPPQTVCTGPTMCYGALP